MADGSGKRWSKDWWAPDKWWEDGSQASWRSAEGEGSQWSWHTKEAKTTGSQPSTLGQCLRSHGTPNDAHETATADGDSAGGDGAAKADGDSAGGDGAAKVADEDKEGLEELTTWSEGWKRTQSSYGRLDTGAAPSQELQEIQDPVDGSQPSFQERCFQWYDEDKCEWANCDAAWNRTMEEQTQAGEMMFPLYR
jgi:hypothetical protein